MIKHTPFKENTCINKSILATVLMLLIVIYIYTYGIWVQLFGLSNLYRYLMYMIVIVSMLLFFVLNLNKRRYNTLLLVFIWYCCYLLIAYLASSYSTPLSLYNYVFVFLCLLSSLFLIKRIEVRSVIILMIVLGCINSFISIYEFNGNQFILEYGSKHYVEMLGAVKIRANALQGSSLTNGMICNLTTILCVHRYQSARSKKYILLSILSFFGVICSLSRGPLISCAVAIWFMFYISDDNKAIFGKKLKGLGIVLLMIICFVFIIKLLPDNLSTIIFARITSAFNWSGEGGNIGRISTWNMMLSMMDGRYLFGCGLGYKSYQNIVASESGVISIFFELGVVGCLAFFGIYIKIFIGGIHSLRNERNIYLILGLAMMLSILLENLVLQVLESLVVQLVFGFAAALTYHYSEKARKKSGHESR